MTSMEAVLERAVAEHHPRLIMLCSFQKEESVLVDALMAIAPDARIATIDTGVLFPETLTTWKAFEDRFGVEVEVFDAVGEWTGPENCCSTAKVAALEKALGGVDAWITGLRREQGPSRADTQHVEFDDNRGIWKFNPLAEWTEKDLWRRIHERDLPYHPLHDQGYESIGCAPCTQPGSGREGRWAGSDKTECGLHVEPPATTGTAA
jgi:phosphoadenosine phosphosulfate reductase